MKAGNTKIVKRARRQKRIRSKVFGTAEKPRLSIYRSNKFTYAQIIDDVSAKTLVSASDVDVKNGGKLSRASDVGKLVAERAKEKKIKKVVFDRGGFIYAGRVKALAESARSNGLDF
ncbi:MAG: ribosomal protein L18 [Parcubacteria group bacterium GW2011_GWF2_38_76]|nr:MAG: ribosomal protein L18 [Parcubacteria group bacterium GW2011_GWF2_38_76]HBM45895.1 50S ribosomal protein L18 [Patescibacteria group bacterium]